MTGVGCRQWALCQAYIGLFVYVFRGVRMTRALTTLRPAMIPFQLLLSGFFLLSLLRSAKSTALTTAIAANEKLCFYADVDKEFEKIGVRLIYTSLCLN